VVPVGSEKPYLDLMKRSEKYQLKARTSAGLCVLSIAVSAIGCVAAAGAMPNLPVVVWGGAFVALVAVCAAVQLAADAIQYVRMAGREARWEWEREVRPKI